MQQVGPRHPSGALFRRERFRYCFISTLFARSHSPSNGEHYVRSSSHFSPQQQTRTFFRIPLPPDPQVGKTTVPICFFLPPVVWQVFSPYPSPSHSLPLKSPPQPGRAIIARSAVASGCRRFSPVSLPPRVQDSSSIPFPFFFREYDDLRCDDVSGLSSHSFLLRNL